VPGQRPRAPGVVFLAPQSKRHAGKCRPGCPRRKRTEPQFSAVVPVSRQCGPGRIELYGPALVAHLYGEWLLLTAAHVLDELESNWIFIGGNAGLIEVPNRYFCSEKPGGNRENDLIDIGFVPMADDLGAKLDNAVRPIRETDLAGDSHDPGPVVFFGYPWRKSNPEGPYLSPEAVHYTGSQLSDAELAENGFNPAINIAKGFHRKKSAHGTGQRQTAPLPEGISGGGIFLLPKSYRGQSTVTGDFLLIGISHRWSERESLLVGTRIDWLLSAIRNSQRSPKGE
jgi:hypothetical protein